MIDLRIQYSQLSTTAAGPVSRPSGLCARDSYGLDTVLFEEVTARAQKRHLVLQLLDAMEKSQLNRSQLAAKLETSRSQVDRLLDPDNTAIILEALGRLANAVGRQLRIELA